MKKVTVVILAVMLVVLATSCGSGSDDNGKASNREKAETTSSESTASGETIKNSGKILTVYFSRTGNTKKVAEAIHKKVGGDIVELKTVDPYPEDYQKTVDQAEKEQKENLRPALSTKIENMKQYDTVFIGYPIWWGDMPMALYSFLESYDMSGKTVAPFCTHGGSGLSGTDVNIQDEEPGAKVKEGLEISDSDLSRADAEVTAWLEKTGLAK